MIRLQIKLRKMTRLLPIDVVSSIPCSHQPALPICSVPNYQKYKFPCRRKINLPQTSPERTSWLGKWFSTGVVCRTPYSRPITFRPCSDHQHLNHRKQRNTRDQNQFTCLKTSELSTMPKSRPQRAALLSYVWMGRETSSIMSECGQRQPMMYIFANLWEQCEIPKNRSSTQIHGLPVLSWLGTASRILCLSRPGHVRTLTIVGFRHSLFFTQTMYVHG